MIQQPREIEYAICPFNENHKVIKRRLLYHFARCGAKRYFDQQNLKYFQCKYYMGHVFFNLDDLKEHYESCEYLVKK